MCREVHAGLLETQSSVSGAADLHLDPEDSVEDRVAVIFEKSKDRVIWMTSSPSISDDVHRNALRRTSWAIEFENAGFCDS